MSKVALSKVVCLPPAIETALDSIREVSNESLMESEVLECQKYYDKEHANAEAFPAGKEFEELLTKWKALPDDVRTDAQKPVSRKQYLDASLPVRRWNEAVEAWNALTDKEKSDTPKPTLFDTLCVQELERRNSAWNSALSDGMTVVDLLIKTAISRLQVMQSNTVDRVMDKTVVALIANMLKMGVALSEADARKAVAKMAGGTS